MTRAAAALATLALFAPGAAAQQWGTIKGQIVWTGAAIPKPGPENVTADKEHCLAKGPLLKDALLIDSKSNGIKDVIVWLEPVDKKQPLAIHPNLKAIPKKAVEIDQPCCHFEPRCVAIRAGQPLIIKNSSPKAHSAKLSGRAGINIAINLTIQPEDKLELSGAKALRAEPVPMTLACALHPWMGGRIGVFDHPYFAVTGADGRFEIKDAPAGEVIIKILHDDRGWLHTPRDRDDEKKIGGSFGQRITVPAKETLDLGRIQHKPEDKK